MKSLRTRLDDSRNDAGLTLIEVVVALMLLGIVAVGVGYSLASILKLTQDARSREVAIGLAAEVIDDSRSIENVFDVGVTTFPVRVVGGDTFTMVRTTQWVTSANVDAQCGAAGGVSAGGSFEFKRVNVEVSWEGMRGQPVRSDTLIAPNERINEENKGTILVSIQLESGAGAENLVVSAVPNPTNPNGAVAINVPILPTDEEGCTYILKVVPGNYIVSVSKSGWIDAEQFTTPKRDVSVAKDASSTAGFQFDQASTYKLAYAGAAATAVKPTNNTVSFTNTYGEFPILNPSTGGTALHPYKSGYTAMAGNPDQPAAPGNLGCLAPDPANWPTRAADGAIGARVASASAVPGAVVTAPIAMGTVAVSATTGDWLTAVSQKKVSSGPDDPGCETVTTLTFPKTTASSTIIALPYGSWIIYKGNSSGNLGSQLNPVKQSPFDTVNGKIITLDPRTVVI